MRAAKGSHTASLEARWPGWVGVNPFQALAETEEDAGAGDEAAAAGQPAEQGTREAAEEEVRRLEVAAKAQKAAAKSLKEMAAEARGLAVAAARQLSEAICGAGTSNEELEFQEGQLRWQTMSAECGRQAMHGSHRGSSVAGGSTRQCEGGAEESRQGEGSTGRLGDRRRDDAGGGRERKR